MTGTDPTSDAGRSPTGVPAGGSMSISGGTFVGSSVGVGRVDNHARVDARTGVGVAELRELLAAHRDLLVAAAPTDEERVVVGYELRKLDEELARDEPRPERVRSHWERVRDVLGGLTAGSTAVTDAVTAVGGLVTTVLGG